MSYRFEKIDELAFNDHTHLNPGKDSCYYLMKYTSNQGFGYSDENSLIGNLKKPLERKAYNDWKYKEEAINRIAKMIGGSFSDKDLARITFVPVPPSKAKSDPLHDDRLMKILQKAFDGRDADIREALLLSKSMDPVHYSTNRGSKIIEFQTNLEVDENLCEDPREAIFLFDDMLTTGAHFKVCRDKLMQYFPGKKVMGIFVARRIFPD